MVLKLGRVLDLERSPEMTMGKIEVRKIADGLGYGEGAISYNDRKSGVDPEVLFAVETTIQNPDTILIPISLDKKGKPIKDDGCPDGRPTKRIFKGAWARFKSLTRPKVFGGGATMIVASTIGLGEADDKSIKDLFASIIDGLTKNGVEFGAHTDNHSKASECGCGAIDNAPAIISNTIKYRNQISSTIEDLGIDSNGLDDIFANFDTCAQKIKDEPHTGAEVMSKIMDADKIVKEVGGAHLEMYIILNYLPGYTINQEAVRQISNEEIQVFGVDVWRLNKLVEKVYPDKSSADKHKAFLSEIVYSLSTAATLTKGDLPVYAVSDSSKPDNA